METTQYQMFLPPQRWIIRGMYVSAERRYMIHEGRVPSYRVTRGSFVRLQTVPTFLDYFDGRISTTAPYSVSLRVGWEK